ncbi:MULTISPECIES: copper chaperone PCu(A)C [unclassified Streptomyces]|uniref:copper chaperone PCu(A)C n=1 Tax=unclassified Streptomyces TaxID=2593676 RepID=UPI00344E4441
MNSRTTPLSRRIAIGSALALTAGLALTGCGGGDGKPQLSVSGAYMPQPVTDQMAGAYFVVKNDGAAADKLTSVTSDLAKDITLHTTDGNKMERVDSLPVPANGELKLSSGGDHVMFMGLTHKPTAGQKVTVELHFATASPVKVEVPVKPADYRPGK